MTIKKLTSLCFLSLMISQSAMAESIYGISLEYEAEKEKLTGEWSDTGYIIPSFTLKNNSVLDKVEILLGYTQSRTKELGSSSALGVRLRKNIAFNDSAEGFVRAAIGHTYISANGAVDYNWGYIEPGLELKLNHTFGLTISDRIQNSIDGTRGMSTNSIRIGPNIEIDDKSELELRYISTTGDYESSSYMAEYSVKF